MESKKGKCASSGSATPGSWNFANGDADATNLILTFSTGARDSIFEHGQE
jgi:hypothetical protein